MRLKINCLYLICGAWGGMCKSGQCDVQYSRVGSDPPVGRSLLDVEHYFVGSSQGTIGINGAGFASGEAKRTAIAPRKAPVNECVTMG